MKRRPSGPLLVSAAIHVVVVGAVLHAIDVPRHITNLFRPPVSAVEEPLERLRYVEMRPAAIVAEAPRSEPTIRAGVVPETPRLVAPTTIPSTIAPPTEIATPVAPGTGIAGGTGTGDPGGRGNVSVTPAYSDPRIWNTPSGYTPPPMSQAEDLEQYLARGIKEHLDSIAAAPKQRDPRDWTFERGGQKYGMDDRWIHVGKFKLPSALLAMIPVNAQANPNAVERYRRINEMSAEIEERRALELDSRDEIARINARMDRQRAAKLKAKASGGDPGPPDRD